MLKEENNIGLIITLLEEKNHCLQAFLEVSERERKSFKARNFENLEMLYEVRENILENIRTLDRRIDNYSKDCSPESLDGTSKSVIKKLLDRKEVLVSSILNQDLVMLSCVENEKSAIIKKITSARDGRRLLKAYRFLPDIID